MTEYMIEARDRYGRWYVADYAPSLHCAFHAAELHGYETEEQTRVRNRYTGIAYAIPVNACARVLVAYDYNNAGRPSTDALLSQ